MYTVNQGIKMSMTLTKWGNSVGLRLSYETLRRSGWKAGDKIDMEFQEETGVIVLRLVTKKQKVDIKEMIASITVESLPDVSDFETRPVGAELW